MLGCTEWFPALKCSFPERDATATRIIGKGGRGLPADRDEELKKRVASAAEAALAQQQYVSAVDILTRIGLLAPTHLEGWRKGRIDVLERAIHANPKKVSHAMASFHQWALDKGLKPNETRYVRTTRGGNVDLQFSEGGEPAIEKNYRTHYVSPALSESKQERLTQKLSAATKPVVFDILRDSACSECGAVLPRGSFLAMEADNRCACRARGWTTSSIYRPAIRR